MSYQMNAPCLFGLESVLAGELREMGAENVAAENGRVRFSGDLSMIARANLCSRYGERIQLVLGSFPARSFTELFDGVRALPLEDYIGKREAFPVKGWSLDSQLHSVPDCQAIIKKAAAERLMNAYGTKWMEESGAVLQLQFSIHKDRVTLMLDTSGEGLHKRGYRENSAVTAPLKETLAAGLVYLMRIYPDSKLIDPFCGSGTILIEGALMAQNMAPGLHRYFAAERFSMMPKAVFQQERARALEQIRRSPEFEAVGYDIDSKAVELTLQNAKKAGVADRIKAYQKDFKDFEMPQERSLVITNPPYGERLLDVREAERLYSLMGEKFERQAGKRYGIISPHENFESLFGRPADKRRKLYNGMIRCQLFQYFK